MVERRCIASGEIKPAEELIRFVCGPDGALVPDLARKTLAVVAGCRASQI